MKRLIAVIISCLILGTSVQTMAKNGDIVGHIYSTDIIAYVCGTAVPSYNIGGRTVIVIEEAAESCNSIYYDYDDSIRQLDVEGFNAKPQNTQIERGKVGKIVGDVYDTDIKVVFNGSPIKGYNIGGRTAVCIEDLGGDNSTSPNEQYGYSLYAARHIWDAENRTISLEFPGTIRQFNEPAAQFSFSFADGIYKAEYTPDIGYVSSYDDGCSPEYLKDKYVFRPLEFELDGKREVAGFCFVNINDNIVMQFDDYDSIKARLNEYRESHKPNMSHDEAVAKFNDGVKYKTLQTADATDYTFIVAQDLQATDSNNDLVLVSVPESGGYVVLNRMYHYEQTKIETNGNVVTVEVYPFGGPHGAVWCNTEYNLDEYR